MKVTCPSMFNCITNEVALVVEAKYCNTIALLQRRDCCSLTKETKTIFIHLHSLILTNKFTFATLRNFSYNLRGEIHVEACIFLDFHDFYF